MNGELQPENGMPPPQQRFGPDDVSRDQIHLRLVLKYELVIRDGPLQIVGQPQPAARPLLIRAVEFAGMVQPIPFGML